MATDRASTTGGREMVSLHVARTLATRGHEMHVYFEFGGDLEPDYRSFSKSVSRGHLRVRRPGLVPNLIRAAPSLSSAARRRPDVVYVHSLAYVPFGALVCRLIGAPLVCHLHGYLHYNKALLLARQVSQFVCVSEDAHSKWIEEGVDAAKLNVVHNGVDVGRYSFGGLAERERARRELGLPPDGFVALYYGRLDKEKGVDVLLQAWRMLDVADAGAMLLIMGESVIDPDPAASERRLRDLAPAGCRWLPMSRDVLTPLHAADVMVLPSFAEGFSLTVLEALATGRPVVATRVGGTPEALFPPLDQLMFEPGDPAALTRVLKSVMNWRSDDPGLGERCRRRVTERFTVERMATGVENVLLEAATARGGRGP